MSSSSVTVTDPANAVTSDQFSPAPAVAPEPGINTADVTVTAVGSAPNDNGDLLVGQVLTLEPADATHPGLLTAGAQSIGGAKTFTGAITASNISGTNTGDQTTVTGNAGTATALQTARTINGVSFNGTANITVVDSAAVVANVAITGASKTKVTYDAKGLVTSGADATTADIAASTNRNYVTDAQQTVIGNTSGTNSGDITLATVGSTPANAGASLSGQVLTLQPADATHGGVLSTTTQTIPGAKTFSSEVVGSVGFTTTDGTIDSPVTGSTAGTKAFLMNASAGVSSLARVLSLANAATEVFFVFAGGDIAARDASSDIGGSSNRWRDLYLSGSLRISATDSTGTPGAATINKTAGRSAIALGASSVVITNNQVVAGSLVFIQPLARDATGLLPAVTTTASGSFTVSTSANCTAALSFNWHVINVL